MAVVFNEDLLSDYSARVVLSGVAGIYDPLSKTLHLNTREGLANVWEPENGTITIQTVDDDWVVRIEENLEEAQGDIPVFLDIVFPGYTHAQIRTEKYIDKSYIESLGKWVISSTGCIYSSTSTENDYVDRDAWERYMLGGMDYLRRNEYPIINEYGGIKFNHDIKREYSELRIYSPGATKYSVDYESAVSGSISGFRLTIPRSTKFIDFYGTVREKVSERHGFSSEWTEISNSVVPIKSLPGISLHLWPGELSPEGGPHIKKVCGHRIFFNPVGDNLNVNDPARFYISKGNLESNLIYITFSDE